MVKESPVFLLTFFSLSDVQTDKLTTSINPKKIQLGNIAMITFILQQFNKNTLSIIFINGKYALNMPV